MTTLYYLIGARPVLLECYEHYETVKAMDWQTGKFAEEMEFLEIIRNNPNGIAAEVTKEAFDAHVRALFADANGNPVPRVTEDELTMIGFDGVYPIWAYNGERFSGILMCFEDDGTLSCEIGCTDGYEDGWHRAYHPNGRKSDEYRQLHSHVVSGTYKEWDEDGNLIASW